MSSSKLHWKSLEWFATFNLILHQAPSSGKLVSPSSSSSRCIHFIIFLPFCKCTQCAQCAQKPEFMTKKLASLFSVGLTGGQDDFFTFSPHLLNGIDVSQVQDIDRVEGMKLPTVTDSSGKPLFTGLYSGPYFDLRRMTKNQTVQIGEPALIHCAVKQVGENSVIGFNSSRCQLPAL